MAPRNSLPPAIDLEKLAQLRQIAPKAKADPVKTLMTHFLRETPMIIQSLENSLKKREGTKVFESAEHLKSRCTPLGATRLIKAADQVLEAALTSRWENAQHLLPKLRSEFAVAERILRSQPEYLPDPARAA